MNKIFLLDASGSMMSRIDDAIGSFNSFVKDQEGGTMSLYTFNDKCTCVYKDKALADVKPLDRDSYKPTGMTALYDSIAHVLKNHDGQDGILVIMTDGEENTSKKYTKSHVKDLIRYSKLQIIYAGVDINDAQDMGIHSTFYYDGNGTPDVMKSLSQEVATRASQSI